MVPPAFVTHEFDAERGGCGMRPNRHFLEAAEGVAAREGVGKDDPVFVRCRSGGRSALAARALAGAGWSTVWNLVEGFEGDEDPSEERSANGWRNAGLPWTCRLTARQAWTPPEPDGEGNE